MSPSDGTNLPLNIEIDHQFNEDLKPQTIEEDFFQENNEAPNLLDTINRELASERDPLLNNLQAKLIEHNIMIEIKENYESIIDKYNKRMAEDAIL